MTETFSELAWSITKEPGFLWKIWTENENAQEAGEFTHLQQNKMLKTI